MQVNQQGDSDSLASGDTGVSESVQCPQRRLSWILFWYVGREFLVPLVCCLLAFVALFLIRDLFNVLLDVLQSQNGGLGQLLVYFLIQQPITLPQVLPMSVLLSASFMVSGFQRHHELSAMRAGGLSLSVCARPVWVLGLLLSVFSLWIGESFAPRCATLAQDMRDRWTETEQYVREHGYLSYSNNEARRDWFFGQFAPTGEQRDILVKQFRPDHSTEWELTAERAQYIGTEWVFSAGSFRQFDDQGRLPEGAVQRFDRRVFPALDETPAQILNQLRPVDELSIARMRETMRLNPSLAGRTRRTIHTTIWYRLTFPFSCLVGALLGVALSLARERGSTLRGFAVAIGLMVVYYVSSQMALVLGQQGYVPPFVGGALPTLCFLGLGGWQMYRKR